MERFELLRALISAKHTLSLFPDGHPMVQEKAGKLLEVIENLAREENKAEISIIDGELFINEHSLRQESLDSTNFIKELTNTEINRINFQPGITKEEIISLLNYLNELQQTEPTEKFKEEELRKRGIVHILVSKIVPLKLSKKEIGLLAPPPKPKSEYEKAVHRVQDIFDTVLRGRSFSHKDTHFIVEELLKKITDDESTLKSLFNIKIYDDYTFRHSVNVALLSLLVGKRLKLNQELLSLLGEAALLHDIGKIMIPKEIITKPGPLNPIEWQITYHHPSLGAEILSSIPGVAPSISCVALEHHVHYDGSGYPRLRIRTKNNYLTQIVSICDFYDALTTIRSYRKPMLPHQTLLLMLHKANTQFNPSLVKVFISVVGFFPVGTLVKTAGGQVGIVTKINPEDPLHPVIKLLKDERGRRITPKLIDTSKEHDKEGLYFEKILA